MTEDISSAVHEAEAFSLDPDFLDQIKHSFLGLFELGKQAYQIYRPHVNALIHNQISDPHEIEMLLDYLLGFCFDSDVLQLYKQLCSYYFPLNPHATAAYIDAYREMWDEEVHSK